MPLEFRNLASVVMGLRDKIVGNETRITDDSGNINWSQITLNTIASQIEYEIHLQQGIIVNPSHLPESVDTTAQAVIDVVKLNRARNVVNAVRLNGRTARINQEKRWEASNVVAEVVARRKHGVDDGTATPDFLKLSDFIGAEIGYRRAQIKLK